MEFKIFSGRLKEVKSDWHKYLEGKKLLVGTGLGQYMLLAIEGEDGLDRLCEYAWNCEPEEEHEYDKLDDFISEVELGNDGFGFAYDEIEDVGA